METDGTYKNAFIDRVPLKIFLRAFGIYPPLPPLATISLPAAPLKAVPAAPEVLKPIEHAALDALALYGPGARLLAAVIAGDLAKDAAMVGRIFGELERKGYVKRLRRHNQLRIELLPMPSRPLPVEAVKIPPPETGPKKVLSRVQRLILDELMAAGDTGTTMRDLAATLSMRSGPVARSLMALIHSGHAERADGPVTIYRAIKDAAGGRIERFPPGTKIEYRADGVRIIKIPPAAARGYVGLESSITAKPTGNSRFTL